MAQTPLDPPIEHFDRLPINLVAQRLCQLEYAGIYFPIDSDFLIEICGDADLYNNAHNPADINLFRYHTTLLSTIFCPIFRFIGQHPESKIIGVNSDICFEVKSSGLEYFDLHVILDPTLPVERFVTNHAAVLIIDHDFQTVKFIDPHVGKTHPNNINTIRHICRELIAAGYVYTDTTNMPPSFQSLYDVHDYVGMGCVSWAIMLGTYVAINRKYTIHELFEPFYSNEASSVLHLFVYWYKQVILQCINGVSVNIDLNGYLTEVFEECQDKCISVIAMSLSSIFDCTPGAGRFLHDMCQNLSTMLIYMQQKMSNVFAINLSDMVFVWAVVHQLNLMLLLWGGDFNNGANTSQPSVNSTESKIIYFIMVMYKLFGNDYYIYAPPIPHIIRQLLVEYYVEPYMVYPTNHNIDNIRSTYDYRKFTQFIHLFNKLINVNAEFVNLDLLWETMSKK